MQPPAICHHIRNGDASVLIKRVALTTASCVLSFASGFCVAGNSQGALPAKDCVLTGQSLEAPVGTALTKPPFPPIQLDVKSPIEPTLFSGGNFNYVIYELNLESYADTPLALKAIEIFDAGRTPGKPLASLAGAQLYERTQAYGADSLDAGHPLESGRHATVFVCLAFRANEVAPSTLGHHVLVGESVAEGPTIAVRRAPLNVLAAPVTGTDWLADNGPSLESHHRTGVFVAGGQAHLSRRFAIDWKRTEQGSTFAGNPLDVHSYYSYGEPVFAVADAAVVFAKDGFPDNVPKTDAGFETALPLTMENVGGNTVVLDLGGGQFAYYAHLKPGSVRVKTGDHVRRGQAIAQVGNSGDARWPHLHFQVTNSPDSLASEGVPYVLDSFQIEEANGTSRTVKRQYPIGDITVDLGAAAREGHR
jgi:hypothetical protein